MAIIDINYSTYKAGRVVYRGVRLRYQNNEKKKDFKSKDFVKDWFDCKRLYVIAGICDAEPLMHSSSVDHFIMDGAQYESAYLHCENGEPILKYIDKTDENYLENQNDIYEHGSEYFVEPGTKPNWNELRVRCGLEPIKK